MLMTYKQELTVARQLQVQIIELLERGGMALHRWCANYLMRTRALKLWNYYEIQFVTPFYLIYQLTSCAGN